VAGVCERAADVRAALEVVGTVGRRYLALNAAAESVFAGAIATLRGVGARDAIGEATTISAIAGSDREAAALFVLVAVLALATAQWWHVQTRARVEAALEAVALGETDEPCASLALRRGGYARLGSL